MGETVWVGVLGPLKVRRGGVEVEITAPRERAVLAALALRAGHVTTGELIADVWGERPPRSAPATLHGYMAQLRRRIEAPPAGATPAVIARSAQGYRLVLPAGGLDAIELEERHRTGVRARAAGRPERALAELRAATALWRGRPYVDLGDAPAADAEAVRLEQLWLAAVEERIDVELDLGGHASAVAELEVLVDRHPYRERLWVQLMVGLYRSGRQADALRAYARVRALLVEELGIEPGPELRAVEARVLGQDATLELPRESAVSPGPSGEPVRSRLPGPLARRAGHPLRGRADEMARLGRCWAQAVGGSLQVALVAGEPGIGKTRLVTELALAASESGRVLSGRGDPALGNGYGPVVEIIRQALDGLDEADRAERVGPFGESLARLVPELRARSSTAGPEPALEARIERQHLFDAVTHLLAAIASARPVLVVIDDLHWAEQPTAALVGHLLHQLDAPVLVVCTYRDTELAPHVQRLVTTASLLPGVHRLQLGGLSAEAVAALWTDARRSRGGGTGAGVVLPAAERERLCHYTGGNPLLITELAGAAGAGSVASAPVPRSILDLTRTRIEDLGAPVVEALRMASAVGEEFDHRTVAGALGAPTAGLTESWEAAQAAGLIDEVPDAVGRFRFRHTMVREAVYGGLSALRRAQLHDRLADHLAQEGADTATIAHHALASVGAGDATRAVAATVAAAQDAIDQLAFENGVALLERAIEVIEAEPGSARLRAELLAELAMAQWASGDREGGQRSALEAAAAARGLDLPDVLGRAALAMVQADRAGELDPAGVALLEEALGSADHAGADLHAALLGHLAVYRGVAEGELARAIVHVDDAIRLARGGRDPATLPVTLARAALVLRFSPWVDREEEVLTELGELVIAPRTVEAWWARGLALRHRPVVSLVQGRRDEFLAGVARLEDVAASMASESPRAAEAARLSGIGRAARLLRATWALAAGHLADAEHLLDELAPHALSDANFMGLYGSVLYLLRREQHRLAEILPFAELVAERSPALLSPQVCLASIRLAAGDTAGARRLFRTVAPSQPSDFRHDVGAVLSLAVLTELAVDLGETGADASLRQLLEPYRGQLLVVASGAGCLGAADRYLAMLDARGGAASSSAAGFERALALEARLGAALLEARTRQQALGIGGCS